MSTAPLALTLVNDENSTDPFRGQRDLIKRQIAPGIDDGNLALFGIVCARTGLDPFLKQIYTIKRGDKWTIQTGIDGYRLLAARTGQLAGIEDAEYDTEDEPHPNKARVTVWRFVAGQRVPFTATARWSEYKPEKGGGMWDRMPFLMLAKCAESLALRKAFPAELSGVYTAEEMAQADTEAAPTRADLDAYAKEHGISSKLVTGGLRKYGGDIRQTLDAMRRYVAERDAKPVTVEAAPADDGDDDTITFEVDETPASLEQLPVGTRGV